MSYRAIFFMGFHYCVNKDQTPVLEPRDLNDLLPKLSNAVRDTSAESESRIFESESSKQAWSLCLSKLTARYWNAITVNKGNKCDLFGITEDYTVSLQHQITASVLCNERLILTDNRKQFYMSDTKNKGDCKIIETKDSAPQIVHLESCESAQFSVVGLTDTNEVGVCTFQDSPHKTGESCPEFKLTFMPICNHIISISCGKEHVLMLSKIGVVYSYGTGSRGQLGNGSTENSQKATIIEALEGITVLRIAAGGWHSMALADTGDIYSWGWNESGQLGLPSSAKSTGNEVNEEASNKDYVTVNIQTIPVLLEMEPDEINFTDISCGWRHSAAITDNGKLFTWGWNKYGQLGHGKTQNVVNCPTAMQNTQYFSEKDICVKSVKCGPWCTFVEVQNKS